MKLFSLFIYASLAVPCWGAAAAPAYPVTGSDWLTVTSCASGISGCLFQYQKKMYDIAGQHTMYARASSSNGNFYTGVQLGIYDQNINDPFSEVSIYIDTTNERTLEDSIHIKADLSTYTYTVVKGDNTDCAPRGLVWGNGYFHLTIPFECVGPTWYLPWMHMAFVVSEGSTDYPYTSWEPFGFTRSPTFVPTKTPITSTPTKTPSSSPSRTPTTTPTSTPTVTPTSTPSTTPTTNPTSNPTTSGAGSLCIVPSFLAVVYSMVLSKLLS